MTFPALRPTSWPRQHGTYPASIVTTIDGHTSVVRHSDLETGGRVSLSFVLTEQQFLDIIEHHEEHGSVFSFDFDPVTLPAYQTPSGYRWKYVDSPQVTDRHTDIFNVSCVFEASLFSDYRLSQQTAIVYIQAVGAAPSIARTVAPSPPTMTISGLAGGVTTSGWVAVAGIEAGASWQYSTDGGATWEAASDGAGGFQAPTAAYLAGAIRARQTAGGLTSSAAQTAAAVVVADPSTAVIVATIASGATGTGTVALPRSFLPWRITSSHAGWFSIYSSAAGAALDTTRLRAQEMVREAGVIRDPVFVAAGTINLSPPLPAANHEVPQTNTYPWRFVNDGASGEVVITLSYVLIGSY
jgi:hypothetical protein